MINTLPKLVRRFLTAALALMKTLSVTGVEIRAKIVIVAADAARRGAPVAGNKSLSHWRGGGHRSVEKSWL